MRSCVAGFVSGTAAAAAGVGNARSWIVGESSARTPRFLSRGSSFGRAVFRPPASGRQIRTTMSADLHAKPVGFIGLGIMGAPMALNLVNKANRKLLVWNRDPSKAEALKASLPDPSVVSIASSPSEVLTSCTLTYAMLSTPEATRAVFHESSAPGEKTALQTMPAGHVLVDCSTLTEEMSKETADAVSASGAKFLEAPVSGSKVPAETGTLIFLCAGDKDSFDAIVENDLEAMGKKSVFLGGEVGAGTRMKLVVNQIMGAMMVSLSEGITLSEACGLNSGDLIDVLGLGAMANPMFALKGPKMKGDVKDYAPHFPLEHAQKDMRFAGQLAEKFDVTMPVAAAANEVFKAAKADGRGREDFSAVIEALRRKSV